MGLDFSHCDAHWAYSGFDRFRGKLAKEIGVSWDALIEGVPKDSLPSDPILNLLLHSDCDGELTPEECSKIAPRLRELVAKWGDDDYDKRNALELAEGMEEAAELKEALQFR